VTARPPAPAPRACLVPVPLAEVALRRDEVLARSFSPAEAAALQGRADRSVAGRLALKRALADLWPLLLPGSAPQPADFAIASAADGGPVLAAAPGPAALRASVRVSISHSRTTAWGLAAGPSAEGAP
jgi:hypothetical protein